MNMMIEKNADIWFVWTIKSRGEVYANRVKNLGIFRISNIHRTVSLCSYSKQTTLLYSWSIWIKNIFARIIWRIKLKDHLYQIGSNEIWYEFETEMLLGHRLLWYNRKQIPPPRLILPFLTLSVVGYFPYCSFLRFPAVGAIKPLSLLVLR